MKPFVACLCAAWSMTAAGGPVITSTSPGVIDAGGPLFKLTIIGSGFTNGAAAYLGNTVLPTKYVNSGQLTAEFGPDLRLIADSYPLTVVNGDRSVSPTFPFTVLPVIGPITPVAATAGSGPVTVTITGIGFQTRMLAQFVLPTGVINLASTVKNANAMTAVIPASALTVAQHAAIQILDPVSKGVSTRYAYFDIDAAPNITSLSPNPVDAGGVYFLLDVIGSGFSPAAAAYWPGGVALGTNWVSNSKVQVAITPELRALAGTFPITVTDPGTGAVSNASPFTVSPVLFSISPASALSGGPAVTITVSGAGFTSTTGLTMTVGANATPLATTLVNSKTMTAVIPATALRTASDIGIQVVDSAGGGHSLVQTLKVSAGIPVLTSLVPTGVLVGAGNFILTVLGSNFTNSSALLWNGSAIACNFINSTELTAIVPGALAQTAGTAAITVANSGGAPSAALTFTIRPQPGPVISAISPTSATAGAAGFTLTITAANCGTGCVAQWNGAALTTTIASPATVTAAVPASLIASAGTASIRLVNPDGGASDPATFTINPPPATAASLNPSSATAGSPALTLTVNGSNLLSGAAVLWNGSALTTSFVSATQLIAAVPASLLQSAGTATVTVANTGSAATAPLTFTIHPPAPTLASMSPTSATAGAAGFTLVLTVANCGSGCAAQWNGAQLATTVVNATTVTAAVPASLAAQPGTAAVRLVNQDGGMSGTLNFVINPVVTLSGLSPNSVVAGSPQMDITVTGRNFLAGATVLWNGGALATMFVNSAQLTATVPAALLQNAATVPVTVMNPGAAPTPPMNFSIRLPAPVLTSISPTSAAAGSAGFTLTIASANCGTGCTAQWNGTPLPTSFVSTTAVSASVPASLIASPGPVSVRLVNPDGGASGTASFTINPGASTVTAVSPASITSGSPATLTVTGSNFAAGAAVLWNGMPLTTTFVSATQLTASLPAALAGGLSAIVTVSNPGGAVSNGFVVTIDAPRPTIASLSPATVTAGGGAFMMSLTGQNFAVNCVARWNGTPLYTSFVSDTQASASVPAELIGATGSASVTLANASGLESNAVTITITPGIPLIQSMDPVSTAAGSPALALTINGANFLAGSKVLWNGSPLSTTFVSSARVKADLAAGLLAAPGLASVAISNPGAGASGSMIFAIGDPQPSTTPAGIVSTASSLAAIAPGSLISIYGTNLAAGDAAAPSLPLPMALNGTAVTINGIAAPVVYVSAGQINAQVPFEVTPGDATLAIQAGARQSAPVNFTVRAIAPGILPVIENAADGSVNSAQAPAHPGDYLTLWVTGQGALATPIATGAAAPSDPIVLPLAAVTAQLGGQDASVSFAGMAPGMAGLLQVNLRVPGVPAGGQPLVLTVGGVASNQVTVAVGQ
jgi:uncharacterized protein (TIGR03437 family)